MNAAAQAAGGGWTEKDVRSFSLSPFARIGEDWMLISAGGERDWNAMTASWGGLGVLWNANVAFAFVRPTRHTFGYLERADSFSLSFFDPAYRKALSFFGAHSGRDCDKAAGAGLTPIVFDDGCLSFAEAREVFYCRKLYAQDIDPERFIDLGLNVHYPDKDYHRLYIGAIERFRARP